MYLKGLADVHTHTEFSVDSEEPAVNMCLRAQELGLSAYAITDHAECNRWYPIEHYPGAVPNGYDSYDNRTDFENSLAASTKLKEQFAGKLELLSGIELGQATADLEASEKAVSDPRLDFVIGSMHQLPGYDDFAFIKYDRYPPEFVPMLLEKNYAEILKLAQWGKFDVLGHLTYNLRYIEGNYGIKVDMAPYEDVIEEIFKTIIAKGKGIEINTSGLRQNYGDTFPNLRYVKLYRQLGGEIITLGSDAHCAADLGKGIEQGANIARQAGFRYIAYFKQRKPQFIRI